MKVEASYTTGERLYFSPSLKRMPFGSVIGAGMVLVTQVVDHGDGDPTRDRWTYVVKEVGLAIDMAQSQGAAEDELHRVEGN